MTDVNTYTEPTKIAQSAINKLVDLGDSLQYAAAAESARVQRIKTGLHDGIVDLIRVYDLPTNAFGDMSRLIDSI